MNFSSIILVLLLLVPLLPCGANEPKIVAVKQFCAIYPASNSLGIPFHGCVVWEGALPEGQTEHWFSLDHLIEDVDFTEIEVLVDANRTILGARASFKGSEQEWRENRGYESRKRVVRVFLGGDGPEGILSKDLPLEFNGIDFGDMVFHFDNEGHVSWRKAPGIVPVTEDEYEKRQEKHKRECTKEECKSMKTAARVVLPWKNESKTVAP